MKKIVHRASALLVLFLLGVLSPLPASGSTKGSSPSPRDPAVAAPLVHKWIVDRMLKWSPPGRSLFKDAVETKEEGAARYAEIASAAITVAYDPSEDPFVTGPTGRAQSLAILLSLAWFESGFRKDVDLGRGPVARGDKGRSWCMVQVLLGNPDKDGKTSRRVVLTKDGGASIVTDKTKSVGWGGEDLVADRTKCFRVGYRFLRKSFRACPGQAFDDRISVYGAGACLKNWEPSQVRIRHAKRWLALSGPPERDQDVISKIFPSEAPGEKPSPKFALSH